MSSDATEMGEYLFDNVPNGYMTADYGRLPAVFLLLRKLSILVYAVLIVSGYF